MAEHTTKVQQHKVDALEAIKAKLGENTDFIFTDYRGLTVEQITDLRGKLREKSAEYRVMKNRYAKLAFEQLEMGGVSQFLVGPTAIALLKDDSPAIAKILVDYAKDAPIDVKGSWIDGQLFTAAQTEALSSLPGREQLLAMLMSAMNAPLQNFVFALNGVTTKLVRTVQAIADKKASE
jgi:large subunit ribosomal protein L10